MLAVRRSSTKHARLGCSCTKVGAKVASVSDTPRCDAKKLMRASVAFVPNPIFLGLVAFSMLTSSALSLHSTTPIWSNSKSLKTLWVSR